MRLTLLLALALSACRAEGDPKYIVDQDGDDVPAEEDCDDNDASVSAVTNWYLDADGDGYGEDAAVESCGSPGGGYVSVSGDCADDDATTFPGAEELCDEVDNNCDGTIDEGLDTGTWYADADGDGFGDAATSTLGCSGEGWVQDATDCDDAQADVNPGADEVCNERDDDCDGEVDEAGATVYFADADGDGYGDDGVTATGCVAPEGYVELGGDCDDTDAAYNPGATEADCADPNDYNCDGSTGYDDADGDGFPACEECDDGDAAVFPGGAEVCNTIDDDCDGQIDEAGATGGATWYADADGDTYGDAGATTEACDAPEGYVGDPTDCDDRDSSVNPGGAEVCNGVDDDCDGSVDEDAFDPITWYGDADGDGYGDDAAMIESCTAPEGYVSLGGDCDDTDPAYNPGASETDCADPNDYNCDGSTGFADADADGHPACEDCDDGDDAVFPGATEVCNGIDDDCDSTVDLGAADPLTWYADLDGDGFGDPAATTSACDLPAGYADNSDDCDDTLGFVNPDAAEVCDALDDDCDGLVDEDAGDASAWYGDTDGDGYGDDSDVLYACGAPAGYAAYGGDCDDTDPAYHPGAVEADCADSNDYNCDGSVAYSDADHDGWAACDECDDLNAAVNPAASEACNSIDDDCDGIVDEAGALGEVTGWLDSDGDGYGGDTTATGCTLGAGYVGNSDDCNDAAAAVSPAGTETCNDVDDDCDGSVDEAGSTGETTWYLDDDADGYGGATSVSACDAPVDHVATPGDCLDGDATAYPGATEVCDGVDDDCDGVADDGAIDASVWYTDADGDGWGSSAWGSACEQPSGTSDVDGDCDDTLASAHPGATEACNTIDDDCDGSVDEAGAAGESTWYLDADSDTYGDAASTTSACDAPSGYVADATDCADDDGGIYPGALETCDGVDEDCDAVIDNGATCACPTYTYGDHTYQFCTSALDWHTAWDTCVASGYDLATINEDGENTFLVDTGYTLSYGKWWVGMTDELYEGSWGWVSSETVTYTNWSSGEPNDSGGIEDCMQLGRFGDYTWNDEPCDYTFAYVCEAG